MSFLMIRGKIYHCNQCGAFEKIEYEGGPQLTQVGDFGVMIQKELNKKYFPDLSNPEKEGYYYHIEKCICDQCVDKVPDIVIVGPDKVPTVVMKEWEAQIERFQNKGQEIATSYFHKTMEEITPTELKQLNPMKYILIKQDLKRGDLEKAAGQQKIFCAEIKKTLWNRFMKKMLESQEFKEINQDLKDSLLVEFRKIEGGIEIDRSKTHYSKLNIFGVDSLNPYVMYELSIRKSIKTDSERSFYGIVRPEFDLDSLQNIARNTKVIDLIRDYLTQMNNDDQLFINSLVNKFEY